LGNHVGGTNSRGEEDSCSSVDTTRKDDSSVGGQGSQTVGKVDGIVGLNTSDGTTAANNGLSISPHQ
jgi:hypothetical protein